MAMRQYNSYNSRNSVGSTESDSTLDSCSDYDTSDIDPDWTHSAQLMASDDNISVAATRKRRKVQPNRRHNMVTSQRRAAPVPSGSALPAVRLTSTTRRSSGSSCSRKERLLMRPWLQQQANLLRIPNMCWYNAERTMLRIPWKHGSRSGWTLDDCYLYRAWAEHTGKCAGHIDEPKKWKANFRCALNSLPDVREVKSLAQTRGKDPYKVYEFLSQSSRSTHMKKPRSRRTIPRVGKQPTKSLPTTVQQQKCSVLEPTSSVKSPQRSPPPLSPPLEVSTVVAHSEAINWQQSLLPHPLTTLFDDHSYQQAAVSATPTSTFTMTPFTESVTSLHDMLPVTEVTAVRHGGVIPTVVEELDDDFTDFGETVSAVESLTNSDIYSRDTGSMSPGSSGYLTDSQMIDVDETLEDIESVIPSWCKTDDYYLPQMVVDDDFVITQQTLCS